MNANLTPPATKTKAANQPQDPNKQHDQDSNPKQPREPKEPKPQKEKTVKRSAFQQLYPEDMKLTVLVEENPKKQGSKSRERFEHYFTSKTVGEFLAKGGTYGDIAYDLGRSRIKLG